MNTIKILAALIVMTTGIRGCEEQDDGSNDSVVSQETCMKFCFFPLCDGVTEPGDDYGVACTDQCMSKGTDARAIGQECAEAYSRAIDCHVNLSCEEFKQWLQGDDTICNTERTAFTEACPGMTFDFGE